MNPKRILSLSLAVLAASCVESADKPVLRGQATTKKIQRQRQLPKEESGPCGGVDEICCEFKHQGTDYLYCTLSEHNCSSGVCTEMTTTTSPTGLTGDAAMILPVCAADGETVCDAIASDNKSCSDDTDCSSIVGAKCDYSGCVLTCATNQNNPTNDEFTCGERDACHPSDPHCCVEPSTTVIDEKTGEQREVAGIMYCY